MQLLYIVVTMSMSWYLRRQNMKADADGTIELEGVRNFRYAI
jgi:hypothetical protein